MGDVYDSEDIRRIDPLAPPRNNFDIADNCSITYLNRSVNWANKIPLIVSGGQTVPNQDGNILSSVYGISLVETEVNGMKALEALVGV